MAKQISMAIPARKWIGKVRRKGKKTVRKEEKKSSEGREMNHPDGY
ncbi:MAG: hypothetical protein AAFV95_02200 [Bacteroidota bacterium]